MDLAVQKIICIRSPNFSKLYFEAQSTEYVYNLLDSMEEKCIGIDFPHLPKQKFEAQNQIDIFHKANSYILLRLCKFIENYTNVEEIKECLKVKETQ